MNVVIYARFSSHAQNEQSIEGQLKACYEFAERNNYKIIHEYIDRALTGTTDKRPSFLEMIEDSKKKAFQAVLVYQLDRFARNRYDSAYYKNALKKNGVRVLSVRENITDDASGILIEGLLESMAEYYSAELSQKVKRGIEISAEKCKFFGGRIPLGYKISPEKDYVVDEDTAPIVRRIFQQYAQNVPIVDILTALNSDRIPTSSGGKWTKHSFQALLRNEKYIGVYNSAGKRFENGIPAIIDKVLFLTVQKRLQEKNHMKSRKHENINYILTGKLYCGECHAHMCGESGTSQTGETHYYYKCASRKNNKDCLLKAFPKKALEDLVIDATTKTISKPGVSKYIAENVMKFHNENFAEKEKLSRLQERLAEVEKSLDNIIKAIESGIFGSGTKERIDALEEEKAALQWEIEGVEKILKLSLTEEMIQFWIEKMIAGELQAETYRQNIINTFILKILLYKDKLVIVYTFKEPDGNSSVEIDEIEKVLAEKQKEDELKSSSPTGMVGNNKPYPNLFFAKTFFGIIIPF